MDALEVAQMLEKLSSLGIALLAGTLAALSFLAWRRERSHRMAVVSVAYLLFGLFGLLVFSEPYLTRLLTFGTAEVIEHGASLLVLAGLVVFFFAIVRD